MNNNQTQYEVEHFGSVLLSVSTCQTCGYKHTDVTTLTAREPTALIAKIVSPEDLKLRVIKSGTATISIPEFRATITPGPYSEGYISNVEGILDKIEDALTFMLGSAKGKKLQKGERILKRMRMAREQKPSFTLVIKDPLGNSAIVSSQSGKVSKRALTKAELLKVKFGQYAMVSKSKPEPPREQN
jgi:zinc finger protein